MSVDITVVEIAWRKYEKIRSFQPTQWLISAVNESTSSPVKR
jgi:hypothetical protein